MLMILIAIFAIVIFGLLAVTAMYLLADMFSAQQDKAIFTANMSGGQQIEGAIRAYNAEVGALPATNSATQTVQTLINAGYLRNIRPGTQASSGVTPGTIWAVQGNRAYTPLADTNQCKRMNKFAGMVVDGPSAPTDGCPPCADAQYDQYPACMGTLTP